MVNGKGGKDREVDMPDDLAPLLTQQKQHAESIYESDSSGSSLSGQCFGSTTNYSIRLPYSVFFQPIFLRSGLFADHQNGCFERRGYSRQAVSKALKNAMNFAKVRVGSFHHLRHSYATAALASGMNIRYLQQALGHSDVSTTEIYTHILPENRSKIVSPLDEIN
jgi:integrase